MEQLIQEICVGIFVFVMMISVGLDLRFRQVFAIFRMPRLLFVGLFLNYIIVPAVGVGIVHSLALEPVYAVGLLLVVTTPGGPLGALLTQKVRGNLALATSLVAPPVNQNETSLARSTVKLNRKLTGQSGP